MLTASRSLSAATAVHRGHLDSASAPNLWSCFWRGASLDADLSERCAGLAALARKKNIEMTRWSDEIASRVSCTLLIGRWWIGLHSLSARHCHLCFCSNDRWLEYASWSPQRHDFRSWIAPCCFFIILSLTISPHFRNFRPDAPANRVIPFKLICSILLLARANQTFSFITTDPIPNVMITLC